MSEDAPSANPFFEHPIINSPYESPTWHWELDATGQPTQQKINRRRRADFVTPVPKPKKQKQKALGLDEGHGLSDANRQYELTENIEFVREQVARWRSLPNPNDWRVTPETARLLQHWRHSDALSFRPFFCQVEAVETVIWLTEVAPELGKSARQVLDYLKTASDEANPGLSRLALKLATGAGKTTVMAMLIAWQTINAIRRPQSRKFTKGFLVVTPGITIKERLNVLLPNDADNYYSERGLVPNDLIEEARRAVVLVTNYHAFKRRERLDISKGGRALLQGRTGDAVETLETDGQMLQRVLSSLMGMKNILVLNDEAHHCYREKPTDPDEEDLVGDERKEAEERNEAARLWISGLEAVQEKLGISRVIDLSATPFFLRGSGYAEATLFPWVLSDFSLMDAIECGIVKLPRVPVAENIVGGEMPMYRNLWDNIRKDMPKKGRGKTKGEGLDPRKLPARLQTALQALYGHYEKTFAEWEKNGAAVPPCFIIVCNNTSTSKLVYDYVSGFYPEGEEGSAPPIPGALPLFSNFDQHGNRLPRPNTILVDSQQLESGEALDDEFRAFAGPEVEAFRREVKQRTGEDREFTDAELLREVMNTVGKVEKLGANIRCVVSVSMLTEGWDANTVTHILGVRAFGTQLLCEQVIGRALRRQSYQPNEQGLFNVEYADILGIPFDFAAKPVPAPPQRPPETYWVNAVRPDRDALEIRFPRVAGYRVELPKERLSAEFTADSTLELNPSLVGPTVTRNEGIVGKGVDLSLEHMGDVRHSTLLFHLTKKLLETKWREDEADDSKAHLFFDVKRVAKQWLDNHLVCTGGAQPGLLLTHAQLLETACERIAQGIVRRYEGEKPILAILEPYNPEGSTSHVRFQTAKQLRWQTSSEKCHVNWAVLDSDWEGELCRAAESHPRVVAYVKNQGLDFDVPYRHGAELRRYRPDFILLVDDGRGRSDLLRLVVEVKGYRREDAKEKKATMETYWIPGVNNLKTFGRWAFAEMTEMYEIEGDLRVKVEAELARVLPGAKEDAA